MTVKIQKYVFEEPVVGYIQCKCGGEVEHDQNDDDWHDVVCPDCKRIGCFTRSEASDD